MLRGLILQNIHGSVINRWVMKIYKGEKNFFLFKNLANNMVCHDLRRLLHPKRKFRVGYAQVITITIAYGGGIGGLPSPPKVIT